MYYTYILYSKTTEAFYKGSTADLNLRLIRHNGCYEKATKDGVPWTLIWSVQKSLRGEAQILEYKSTTKYAVT
jgi:predicted GIY-YIG superfamily endonuclease